jgi:hypothetical protein
MEVLHMTEGYRGVDGKRLPEYCIDMMAEHIFQVMFHVLNDMTHKEWKEWRKERVMTIPKSMTDDTRWLDVQESQETCCALRNTIGYVLYPFIAKYAPPGEWDREVDPWGKAPKHLPGSLVDAIAKALWVAGWRPLADVIEQPTNLTDPK